LDALYQDRHGGPESTVEHHIIGPQWALDIEL
jgi:hypothetical protein